MKTYRNIYFVENMFTNGNGSTDINYYGTMYSKSKLIKDFDKQFDPNQDLLINCNACAMKKYGQFIKTNK